MTRFSALLGVLLLAVVFATAAGAAKSAPSWSGRWQFLYYPSSGGNTVALVQKGRSVTGKIPWAHFSDNGFGNGTCESGVGGSLKGTVRGRTLKATMMFPARGGHARTVVAFTATLTAGGRVFDARGDVLTGECSKYSSFIAFTGKRIR